MTSRDPWRTTALALAVVSVLAVLGVTTVAVAVALREEPPAPHPYAGWQVVEGDGGSYLVPEGWKVHPPGERVSYRDEDGRAQARGAALSTYDGGACGDGAPSAWAGLPDPVRARDVRAVATAAVRQWARGFGTGERGAGAISGPELSSVTLRDGTPAVTAEVDVELRGPGTPCGADRGEVTVVAVGGGGRVRLLVVARLPGVAPEVAQILRSLT